MHAEAHVMRCQPKTLNQLKAIVEDFASNMEEELIRKVCRNVQTRAQVCVQQKGSHFEYLLK